jgi:beta-mannosidase
VERPKDLHAADLTWVAASVPGTVAGALAAAGRWNPTSPGGFDDQDWWYRCVFDWPVDDPAMRLALRFGGLATLADVWLNDTHVLASENMFLAHEVDVTALRGSTNVLAVRFRSLAEACERKRPRPRWRTRLVESSQLRWFRTTLLGRIPSWSPPLHTVGPWKAVELEARPTLVVRRANFHTRLDGDTGIATLDLALEMRDGHRPEGAVLAVGETRSHLEMSVESDCVVLGGSVRIPDVLRWWPHTHGAPHLYAARVTLRIEGQGVELDLGRVGFRTVELAGPRDGDFGIRVNGASVFCRGACWTPLDLVTLHAPAASYRAMLTAARDAGMNMLRVGGTMVYEADEFYELCDELGVLVWQDFMFANMDYPTSDATFLSGVRAEAEHTLDRLQAHPCVAILCGNSEVEQQAAMLGLPRDTWENPIFYDVLPEICGRRRPDVPYWPSSPSGGALPFQVNAGVAHYYGVGAYLRPLEDARRSEVRFASECLAFANVPDSESLERMFQPGEAFAHHPRWKSGVPRDFGVGWDFEDVRDHYLERLFNVDPMKLRYSDPERYLALSRLTSGELMAAVFGEWRRRRSTCAGGLVWYLRDLRPGAGWGIFDVYGRPKPVYYYLRRALQPVGLFFTDEGLSGLQLHAANDTDRALHAHLRVCLYRQGDVRVAVGEEHVTLPARDQVEVDVGTLLGGFLDPTYAYRFGPPGHDLVVATLRSESGSLAAPEAFYFPLGLVSTRESDVGLGAVARAVADRTYEVRVRTRRFAQAVVIEARGFVPDDSYFHLAPGGERTVTLTALDSHQPFRGVAQAANASASIAIRIESPS